MFKRISDGSNSLPAKRSWGFPFFGRRSCSFLLGRLLSDLVPGSAAWKLWHKLRRASPDPLAREAALVEWARAVGAERQLTDTCLQVLQAMGTLPEPEGIEHRYRELPPEKLRPLDAFGDYWADIRQEIEAFRAAYPTGGERPIFLDAGGNKGECRDLAEGFQYWLVDLQPRTTDADRIIQADICQPLPLPDQSVDVIFSHQVWEHLATPWVACQELGRLLRPGGLFITVTLFAYRYHPLPEDYFRFTHVGLTKIHECYAQTESVLARYDLRQRRMDRRGGAHLLGSDVPPIDWLGGFRENWFVYYVGRRRV